MKAPLATIHRFRATGNGGSSSHKLRTIAEDDDIAIWITCCDAGFMVDELQGGRCNGYILQNLGNSVPAEGADSTATLASLGFALANSDVRHIVVCGHHPCAFLQSVLGHVPLLSAAVKQSFEPLISRLRQKYAYLDINTRLRVAARENVLLQLDHLQTHSPVREGLAAKRIQLHGWVIEEPSAGISQYNPLSGCFEPLGVEPT